MTAEPEQPAPSLLGVHDKLMKALEAGTPPKMVLDLVAAARFELVEVQRARMMLDAVKADLAGVDVAKVPGGQTYRALALRLAEVIDKRGDDDGPSTTAKLTAELTKVMAALTKRGGGDDDDGFGSFEEAISTPSRG